MMRASDRKTFVSRLGSKWAPTSASSYNKLIDSLIDWGINEL